MSTTELGSPLTLPQSLSNMFEAELLFGSDAPETKEASEKFCDAIVENTIEFLASLPD